MDPITILFVNTILFVLGMAIFVAFYLLDRIAKRKFEEKKANRKHTSTHTTR